MLKETLPGLARVAVLLPTQMRSYSAPALQRLAEAARKLNIELIEVEVAGPSDVELAARQAKDRAAEAVYIWVSPFAFSYAKQIADAVNGNGLPSIHPFLEGAEAGCLFAFGADFKEQNRRAGAYVDKILRGVHAGDLPVEQMSKYAFVINLKAAKSLALTVPPFLLARADEVIE